MWTIQVNPNYIRNYHMAFSPTSRLRFLGSTAWMAPDTIEASLSGGRAWQGPLDVNFFPIVYEYSDGCWTPRTPAFSLISQGNEFHKIAWKRAGASQDHVKKELMLGKYLTRGINYIKKQLFRKKSLKSCFLLIKNSVTIAQSGELGFFLTTGVHIRLPGFG